MVFEVDMGKKKNMSRGLAMTTKFGKICLALTVILTACAAIAAASFAVALSSGNYLGPVETVTGLFKIVIPLGFAGVFAVALSLKKTESMHLTNEQLRIEGSYLTYSYHRKHYDLNPRGLDVVVANLSQCRIWYDEKERKIVINGDVRWHHYSDVSKEALVGFDQMKPMAELRIYPYFRPSLLQVLGLQ